MPDPHIERSHRFASTERPTPVQSLQAQIASLQAENADLRASIGEVVEAAGRVVNTFTDNPAYFQGGTLANHVRKLEKALTEAGYDRKDIP